LFYDIPTSYNTEENCNILSNIGNIETLSIKKRYKYASVKTKIRLIKEFEEKFKYKKWFPGKMTL